jgi:hypothetical protein
MVQGKVLATRRKRRTKAELGRLEERLLALLRADHP